MAHIPLRTIPNPGRTRSTLVRGGGGTVIFAGSFAGPVYTCGSCGASLIEGVRGTNIVDLVLWCSACGAYNESPAGDTQHLDPASTEAPVQFPAGRYDLTTEIHVRDDSVMASDRALRTRPVGTPVSFDT